MITYNAPVTEITLTNDRVDVQYKTGARTSVKSADYCVSNIPCPILSKIDLYNFEQSMEEAIERTTFDGSCKVGWQSKTRFWESDYEIYGGISWTDDIIEQIWYPSNDYFSQKGTLTGAYIHNGPCPDKGQHATEFGRLPLKQRLSVAREGGARLHPEFNNETLIPNKQGISIARQNVPWQEGAWPSWGGNQHDDKDYERILRPDKRFFIVGDQASTLPGWQEGALMSAEHVVDLIGGVKEVKRREGIKAPNTFKILQGLG